MDSHFVGQGQFSRDECQDAHGTSSFAVRQFVAAARGERPVHKPKNDFRMQELKAEEFYCMECCGVRWHDVVYGLHQGVAFTVKTCRCCGAES